MCVRACKIITHRIKETHSADLLVLSTACGAGVGWASSRTCAGETEEGARATAPCSTASYLSNSPFRSLISVASTALSSGREGTARPSMAEERRELPLLLTAAGHEIWNGEGDRCR